jgi:hypothetical protein
MDETYLRAYLLGTLREPDTEFIDQAVFVSDDVALLVAMIEDALVDTYLRGRLSGETLARFESFYLASSRRRAKVCFAACFLQVVDRTR